MVCALEQKVEVVLQKRLQLQLQLGLIRWKLLTEETDDLGDLVVGEIGRTDPFEKPRKILLIDVITRQGEIRFGTN